LKTNAQIKSFAADKTDPLIRKPVICANLFISPPCKY
jgi:hypothetical protein